MTFFKELWGKVRFLVGENRPITDRMRYLQHLISQVPEDMEMLDVYSEEESKPNVLMLIELSQGYRDSLRALGERLEEQRGWDLEV